MGRAGSMTPAVYRWPRVLPRAGAAGLGGACCFALADYKELESRPDHEDSFLASSVAGGRDDNGQTE